MTFDISLYVEYGPLLLKGLFFTVYICSLALCIGVGLGLVVALLQGFPFPPVRWLSRVYIEVMRGTPILILLFLLYYGGPSFGLTLSAEPVGILGLGLYAGGYFAEIFRAGFQSIPKGQIEAAKILGLSSWQIVRHIKIPQMLVLIIPPGINQMITIVKESALLSIITVPELTKVTTEFVNDTYAVVEPYIALALLYWVVVEAISRAGRWFERRITFL